MPTSSVDQRPTKMKRKRESCIPHREFPDRLFLTQEEEPHALAEVILEAAERGATRAPSGRKGDP